MTVTTEQRRFVDELPTGWHPEPVPGLSAGVVSRPALDFPPRTVYDPAVATDYLTSAQVAKRLGISPTTWRSYVTRGHAPKPTRTLGPLNLWSARVVDRWAKARPGQGRRTDLEIS